MATPSKKTRVGIIGAGITGLTLAKELADHGVEVRIWDQARRPGGAIITQRQDGFLSEEGPNSLLAKSADVWEWIQRNVDPAEIVQPPPAAARRYVVRQGRPIAVPDSLFKGITSPLYSAQAKLRLLGEPFRRKTGAVDESVASFVRRRMGPEFLDYGISCLVRGIFAGDPERISIRWAFAKVWNLEQEYGSLVRGAVAKKFAKSDAPAFKPKMFSFREGLEVLPRLLADALKDQLMTSVAWNRISKTKDGWRIEGRHMGDVFTTDVDHLIITVPYNDLATLPIESGEEGQSWQAAIESLPRVEHPPLSTLTLGFARDQVEHPLDGFGMLIPTREKRFVMGSIFSSTLFPGRAPEGMVSLMNFIGGMEQPDIAGLPESELVDRSCHDLRQLLGVRGQPKFVHHRYWPKAIPQYHVGHGILLERIGELEANWDGLRLQGNYRGGPGLSDCIGNALALARQFISPT